MISKFIAPHNVHVILIPKVESAEQIKLVEEEVLRIKKEQKITNDIYFMPIIESALGVIKAYEIGLASNYNCALAIGLEDYAADMAHKELMKARKVFMHVAGL